MYTVVSSVDSASPQAVVMTIGFFRFSDSFSFRSKCVLRNVWRDAPMSTLNSRSSFCNLTETRQISLESFCSVVERKFHMLEHESSHFVDDFVQVTFFFASKFHVCFYKICTTCKLLVRQSIRISIVSSSLLKKSQGWTFLSRSFTKCDVRQSELLDHFFPIF